MLYKVTDFRTFDEYIAERVENGKDMVDKQAIQLAIEKGNVIKLGCIMVQPITEEEVYKEYGISFDEQRIECCGRCPNFFHEVEEDNERIYCDVWQCVHHKKYFSHISRR